MGSELVYVLLVAHFVGDFICQSDWMALNKSKRWDALAIHVTVYSAVLYMAIFVSIGLNAELSPRIILALVNELPYVSAVGFYVLVNAVAHFVQDAITSRINSRLWQANQRHWFFVGIGADQLLHYVTLFVTAGWWLR